MSVFSYTYEKLIQMGRVCNVDSEPVFSICEIRNDSRYNESSQFNFGNVDALQIPIKMHSKLKTS
jgi:hypothetical protein